MKGLEDDADAPAAEAGEPVLAHRRQILARRPRPRPALGRSSPAMIIIMVDLPEPDGPATPTVSPRRHIADSGRAGY